MRKIIVETYSISKGYARSIFGLSTEFAVKIIIVPGIIVISFHHIFTDV